MVRRREGEGDVVCRGENDSGVVRGGEGSNGMVCSDSEG